MDFLLTPSPPFSCPHSFWMPPQVFSKKEIKESNSLDSRIFWPVQRRRKLQRTFHSKRPETYRGMYAKKVLTLSTWILTVSTWMSVRSIQCSKSSTYLLHRKKLFPTISYFFANPQKKVNGKHFKQRSFYLKVPLRTFWTNFSVFI